MRRGEALAALLAASLSSCAGGSYPPKPKGPPPNIVLIVADTVRADHVGSYGHPAKPTPAIDRLAEEGARFLRCYASAPWTLPSHGTLFTGRPPAVHRLTHARIARKIADAGDGLAVAREALLPGRLPTIASILDERGYETLGVSQNPWVGRATTLDCGFRTFWHLWERKEARPVPEPEAGPDLELHPVTRHVRWWLDEGRDPAKPFFIFINYIQPHLPYRPDWPFRRAFVRREVRDELLDVDAHNWPAFLFGGKLSEDDIATLRELYLAEVAQVDAAIGELRRIFEERGLMDRTAWIVTSDHGECIGHHGFLDHQYNLYEDLLRVPLVVRHPGAVEAGRTIEGPAELADILPTILGWIGEPERRRALSLEGMDLFWDLPRRGADRAVIAAYDANRIQRADLERMVPPEVFARLDRSHRAIIRGGRKLILSSDGAREYYDLRSDPEESRRGADPEGGDLEAILRGTLQRWGDRAFGSASRPPEGPRPPIIAISIDALRADHLGCYGYRRPTSPAIDRFAAEGVLFERAYAPVGETNPSFGSMWSGLAPSGHGLQENRRRIAPDIPLLAEIIAREGYATAAFCANPVLRHSGLDRGFASFVYTDDADAPHDAWDESLVRQALAWIDAHRGERFFLWLHFMEPHHPYQPARPWDEAFLSGYRGPIDGSARSLEDLMLRRIPATPEEMARVIALYDGQIAATDARVGRILDSLRPGGLYDRALIVLLADHGEELGDHHLYLYHSASVYEGVLRIPMIARLPRPSGAVPPRPRVPEIVRMADFLPSVLDLLRIPFDRGGIDGESWLALLAADPPAAARKRFSQAISEHHGKIFTIRTERHRFVYNPDGFTPPAPPFPGPWERELEPELRGYPEFAVAREELYDLAEDPREERNLAGRDPETARALQERILAYLRERVRRAGAETFDEATLRRLKELGYMGGGR